MKDKTRKEVVAIASMTARAAVDEARTMNGVFHVLSIRFADGHGLDIPYEPWRPKQSITVDGRWDREWKPE